MTPPKRSATEPAAEPSGCGRGALGPHLLRYWLPIALYVGLIFALSSFSRPPFRLPAIRHLDKLIHFCEYAVLALLLARALRATRPWPRPWSLVLMSILLVGLLAGLDELYQSCVPRRDSDVLDFMADVAGGVAGSLGWQLGAWARGRRARGAARV